MLKRIFSVLLCAVALSAFLSCGVSLSAEENDLVTVVIDPGHGGDDVGAVGKHYESYYNLKAAEYCAEKLRANGNFKVYMTREKDEDYLTLLERGVFADEVDADVLVSIHFNGNDNEKMSGIEVYSSVLDRYDLTPLAESVLSKLSAATGLKARGCFRREDNAEYYWNEEYQWDVQGDSSLGTLSDYYGIITWAAKFGFPAMIIEHAFVTNEKDTEVIEVEENLKKMGEADADALIDYYTGHDHVYGEEPVIDRPVSCVTAGKKSYHCTVCGHRKDVTSVADAPDPDAHYWLTENEVKSTCLSEGSADIYCRYERNLAEKGLSGVSDNVKHVTLPFGDHDYELKSLTEPTKEKDGTKVYVCTVCGDTKTETITYEEREAEIAESEAAEKAAQATAGSTRLYKLIALISICVAAVAVIGVIILAVTLVRRRKAAPAPEGEAIDLNAKAEDLLVEVGPDPEEPLTAPGASPTEPPKDENAEYAVIGGTEEANGAEVPESGKDTDEDPSQGSEE